MKADNHQNGAPDQPPSRALSVMFDVAGWVVASFTLWLFFHLSSSTLTGLRPQLFRTCGKEAHSRATADWKNSDTVKAGSLFSFDKAISHADSFASGVLGWKRDLESMAAEKHLDLKAQRPNPRQKAQTEDQSEGLESF